MRLRLRLRILILPMRSVCVLFHVCREGLTAYLVGLLVAW